MLNHVTSPTVIETEIIVINCIVVMFVLGISCSGSVPGLGIFPSHCSLTALADTPIAINIIWQSPHSYSLISIKKFPIRKWFKSIS